MDFEEWDKTCIDPKLLENHNSSTPLAAGMLEFADLDDTVPSAVYGDTLDPYNFNINSGEDLLQVNEQIEMAETAAAPDFVENISYSIMSVDGVQALINFNNDSAVPIANLGEAFGENSFTVQGQAGNAPYFWDMPPTPYTEGSQFPSDGSNPFSFPQATSFANVQTGQSMQQFPAHNHDYLNPPSVALYGYSQADSLMLAPNLFNNKQLPSPDLSSDQSSFDASQPAFDLGTTSGATDNDTTQTRSKKRRRTSHKASRSKRVTKAKTQADGPVHALAGNFADYIFQANNGASGPQPPVLLSQGPRLPQHLQQVMVVPPTASALNDIRISMMNKGPFRTQLEKLAVIGEMNYAMHAGQSLSNVPLQIAKRGPGKSAMTTISTAQFAQAKRTEPMQLLLARYGEKVLRARPPSLEFLAAIDRRLHPVSCMNRYVLPRRLGRDRRTRQDLPYDVTSFHPGLRNWDGESRAVTLPDCFYSNHSDLVTKKWGNPPAIVDGNGEVVKIGTRTLYDFEILPDKIGRNEFWWLPELVFRLDPRIGWEDILIRMVRNDGSNIPTCNLLQMQAVRTRKVWGMKPNEKLRPRRPVDGEAPDTRGVTPGLIDPQGLDVDENRVYLEKRPYSGFKPFTKSGEEAPEEDHTALEAEEARTEAMFQAQYPLNTVPGRFF